VGGMTEGGGGREVLKGMFVSESWVRQKNELAIILRIAKKRRSQRGGVGRGIPEVLGDRVVST